VVRVAFIGAGNLANRRHYPSLTGMADVELAAVCDLVPERARATAERWGAPRTYQDHRQMLEDVDPDAVYVVMPPQHLFQPLVDALRQGRNVFVEKPPGVSTEQTRVFAYEAARSGSLTMVGCMRRFIPAMTELKRRVEARGPIHTVSVTYLKSATLGEMGGWYGGEVSMLTGGAIHAVDTLRWLAGGEVVRLASETRTLYLPGPHVNACSAHLSFDNGVVGLLNWNEASGRRIFAAEFHGQNVSAYVDADRDSYVVSDDGEPEVFSSRSFGEAAGGKEIHWLGFWHENRHFVDCVKAGRETSASFADAVKTMELLDRIRAGG
jgi:predicted dehydrogenase